MDGLGEQTDYEFEFNGKTLRGWLFLPAAAPPWPAIVMAHGFSGVKEQRLDWFARAFCDAGFAVLVFDFPNLGASDGELRGDIDPAVQIDAYKAAITRLAEVDGVDSGRIGIWGSSYSGGHSLVVAAEDRRVKCVVAQVPYVRPPMEMPDAMRPVFVAEDEKVASGGEPSMVPVVATGGGMAALPTPDAAAWAEKFAPEAPSWRNEVTLSSLGRLLSYRPADRIAEIAPTPLMLVLAEQDSLIPAAHTREAFEGAGEPKRLVAIDCGHFDVYDSCFDDAVGPALDWFVEHLGG